MTRLYEPLNNAGVAIVFACHSGYAGSLVALSRHSIGESFAWSSDQKQSSSAAVVPPNPDQLTRPAADSGAVEPELPATVADYWQLKGFPYSDAQRQSICQVPC